MYPLEQAAPLYILNEEDQGIAAIVRWSRCDGDEVDGGNYDVGDSDSTKDENSSVYKH